MKKQTKIELFLELAKINIEGKTRWVNINEFNGKYSKLKFGNGRDWARNDGNLGKKYYIEIDNSVTPGNSINKIRLNGFKNDTKFNYIRKDIKNIIKKQKCPVLGTSNVEVDHKNGVKNNPRVMNKKTQKLSDFQPLSKPANDAKRQHCKECIKTKKKFDAKRLGYNKSYITGNSKLNINDINCCIGCYWYDIKEFKKNL